MDIRDLPSRLISKPSEDQPSNDNPSLKTVGGGTGHSTLAEDKIPFPTRRVSAPGGNPTLLERMAEFGSILGGLPKSLASLVLGRRSVLDTGDTSLASVSFVPADVAKNRAELAALGPILGDDAQKNVADALSVEPPSDPAHPYVAAKALTNRRLQQLQVSCESPNLFVVDDLGLAHGGAIVRQVAGHNGLVPPEAMRFDGLHLQPGDETEMECIIDPQVFDEIAIELDGENAPEMSDPGIHDLISGPDAEDPLAASVMLASFSVKIALRDDGDDRKVFLNASYGGSLSHSSHMFAIEMMNAKPGSKLFAEAREVLGHAPRRSHLKSGAYEVDGREPRVDEDLNTLKRELIFPMIEEEVARPEYQESVAKAAKENANAIRMARENGIMVFTGTDNDREIERQVDYPRMLPGVERPEGIVVVGAVDNTDLNRPMMAAFSGEGNVTVAGRGVGIPVGIDENGRVEDVGGVSTAAPDIAETAYAISAVAPDYTFEQIEQVLTDPRVAADIADTTRAGAGFVDQFKAILVAKYPHLTSAQLEEVTRTLDQNPEARFTVDKSGQAIRVNGTR